MSELKRNLIKYCRDKIKRDYKAKDFCYICQTDQNLELHHLYSVADLFHTYCRKNGIDERKITTVAQMEEVRLKFAEAYSQELSHDNLYTLCKAHHMKLHSTYGKSYSNAMAPKILKWLEIQKNKQCLNTSVNG